MNIWSGHLVTCQQIRVLAFRSWSPGSLLEFCWKGFNLPKPFIAEFACTCKLVTKQPLLKEKCKFEQSFQWDKRACINSNGMQINVEWVFRKPFKKNHCFGYGTSYYFTNQIKILREKNISFIHFKFQVMFNIWLDLFLNASNFHT